MDTSYLFVREGTNPTEYQAGQKVKMEKISVSEDDGLVSGAPAKGSGQAYKPWFSYETGFAGCTCDTFEKGEITYCRHIIGLFEGLSKKQEKYGIVFLEARDKNEMFASFKTDSGYISTGCDAVDDMLGGGIPRGVVTLLGGPTKVGKTFFCGQMSFKTCMDKGRVLYIDTEHMLRRKENFEQLEKLMTNRWKYKKKIKGFYPMQQHNLYEVGKLFGIYIYVPKGSERKLIPIIKKEYNKYSEIPIFKIAKSKDVDLIIFDGLTQLFKSAGVTTSSSQNLIGRGEIINLIFESFEGIAGELDVGFVLTSHSSRDNRYFNLYEDIMDKQVTEKNIGVWGGSSLFFNVKHFIQIEDCTADHCKGRNIKHIMRRLYPFRRSTHVDVEFLDDWGFQSL